MGNVTSESESRSVMSDSLQPYGLYSPWNSPGQNTGVSCSLLHRIFPTQGSNPGLPHCRQILYHLSYQGCLPSIHYSLLECEKYKFIKFKISNKCWLFNFKSSLGQEDPLEEGVATHSSILAWEIPWTEEPGELQSTVLQRVGHNWSDLAHTHI